MPIWLAFIGWICGDDTVIDASLTEAWKEIVTRRGGLQPRWAYKWDYSAVWRA